MTATDLNLRYFNTVGWATEGLYILSICEFICIFKN